MAETQIQPLVGVIMGSQSDWATMQHTAKQLADLQIPHEVQVISAHRTPDLLFEWASAASARGLEVIIAAAGGAAHLAGVTAAKTCLPVLGVPVGTLAIGKPGAINAALLAAAILGNKHPHIRRAYEDFRQRQTERGLANRHIQH